MVLRSRRRHPSPSCCCCCCSIRRLLRLLRLLRHFPKRSSSRCCYCSTYPARSRSKQASAVHRRRKRATRGQARCQRVCPWDPQGIRGLQGTSTGSSSRRLHDDPRGHLAWSQRFQSDQTGQVVLVRRFQNDRTGHVVLAERFQSDPRGQAALEIRLERVSKAIRLRSLRFVAYVSWDGLVASRASYPPDWTSLRMKGPPRAMSTYWYFHFGMVM